MSKRREPGEWVRLRAGAGFCGESDRLRAQIVGEDGHSACLFSGMDYAPPLNCDDSECREWSTLITEPDPQNGGKQHYLCHVSECEMGDAEAP